MRSCSPNPAWVLALLACLPLASTPVRAAPPDGPLDTSASCTESCHQGLTQRAVQHAPAKRGDRCTRCHEVAEPGRHAFVKPGRDVSPMCLTCHRKLKPGDGTLHKPFADGRCTGCHEAHDSDHPALLKRSATTLCQRCHQPNTDAGTVVHGPVRDGQCVACHDPHQSELVALLKVLPPELCFTCHSGALQDAAGRNLPPTRPLYEDESVLRHEPFAQGRCGDCHLPHDGPNPRLLKAAYPADFYTEFAGEEYALCFGCHQEQAFSQARTLSATRFRNGNLNLHHRHVNRDKGRSCRACHNPHGSVQPALVAQAFDFGSKRLGLTYERTETGGSCTTMCHSPVKYDRCDPVPITMRTSPRQGEDVDDQALINACATPR